MVGLLVNYAVYLAPVFFVLLLLFVEFGRQLGRLRLKREFDGERSGTAAIEGSVFALLGLLVAFTFSGAATRFDERRDLIVQEANAIGTAYLRIDLVPADLQVKLREAFRRYLDSRVGTYKRLATDDDFQTALANSTAIQSEIWALAVEACRRPDAVQGCTVALLPPINDMIDITTKRAMAIQKHPPSTVFFMLLALSLICSMIAGYGMRNSQTRNWIHIVAFSAIITVTIYVIIDLEHPRLGFIRIGDFDRVLQDAIK
jgi:hypothetical protein